MLAGLWEMLRNVGTGLGNVGECWARVRNVGEMLDRLKMLGSTMSRPEKCWPNIPRPQKCWDPTFPGQEMLTQHKTAVSQHLTSLLLCHCV